eukprot:gene3425-6064_t
MGESNQQGAKSAVSHSSATLVRSPCYNDDIHHSTAAVANEVANTLTGPCAGAS